MDHNDADAMTRAMALNLVAWMDASLQPFDVSTFTTGSIWQRRPGGSAIYLGAVILDPQAADEVVMADLDRVVAAWGDQGFALYDCWATRDLRALGFERIVQNPWYLRPPSPLRPAPLPAGLTIEAVATVEQLIEFERASWVGFEESETPLQEWEQFSWHAPETVDDPNMVYLIARLGGQAAAGAIAHITADMVGIYGVSTLSNFRRRGYATALVRAAVALRPDLPACVFPDPPSAPLYTSTGFARAGKIAIWKK
jgi:GNAT superfamily N-acetyltransferase